MLNRRTLLAAAPFALSACSAIVKPARDGAPLEPSQGLLATMISSNVQGSLAFLPYGENSFATRMGEQLVGANGRVEIFDTDRYMLLPIDAGEYMWSRFSVGNRVGRLYSSTRFTVRKGAITYIGHLRVFATSERYSIVAMDREADMREHLRLNHPAYIEKMPFEKVLAEFSLKP